jgi:N-acetylglucosaminyldiphosphoundecaprenol N-acetyl-beta-D-mannosaminyltransferase
VIRTVRLLGMNFADLTVAKAAEAIAARPEGAPFAYVVTPNADHLVRVSHDAALAEIYRKAWMRLLDSRVVAGMARLLGFLVPHVATGSDLTALLLEKYVRPGERITIVGMRPAWIPGLMERCGLAQPAHYDPPMGFDGDSDGFAQAVSFISAHPARFVFLAVGSPRQERLAAAVVVAGGAIGTGLCIGASLDFLTGAQRRAPTWVRGSGLEWAFRLASDPRRLARRYLVDSPRVISLFLRKQ